ncbi:MAG TPA: ABC transporter substrate-binding protein, partial [Stellaceae bacterium]|nr:ABC transporter substrate-binding protein [Stellaceae bacterium]
MKQRITRRDFGLGAVGAVIAGSGLSRAARAATAPIKVGSLLPRSGYEALIGEGCQRAVDLAKKMLPEMGYAIEVVDADTESRPEVARTQAEKLIRAGVEILVGAFDSGQTFAIAQVAEQNGIPFVINIGSDPAIT